MPTMIDKKNMELIMLTDYSTNRQEILRRVFARAHQEMSREAASTSSRRFLGVALIVEEELFAFILAATEDDERLARIEEALGCVSDIHWWLQGKLHGTGSEFGLGAVAEIAAKIKFSRDSPINFFRSSRNAL